MTQPIRPLSGLRRRLSPQRPKNRPLYESLERRELLSATFDSAFRYGDTLDDVGFGVALDSAGNTFHTGYFSGTVDLDPGAGTHDLTSGGGAAGRPYSSFVSKVDSRGKLVWATQLEPTSDSVFSFDVAITPSGESFAGGYIEAEPSRSESLFVSKLDSSGNIDWSIRAAGGRVVSVGTDSSGNLYAAGQHIGNVDIDGDGTPDLIGDSSSVTPFLFKLDNSGKLIWAHDFGGTNGNQFSNIAVDSSGNLYATGFFNNTVDFDPGTGVFNLTTPNNGAFVLKLDKNGNFAWVRSFDADAQHAVQGIDIEVDSAGNVYTTGLFGGTVDFDPGSGTHNIAAGGEQIQSSAPNVYVSKLNSAGNFVWATSAAQSSDINAYQPQIAVNSRGEVYVVAGFSGSGDFDQRPTGCADVLTGSEDLFLLKLDNSGQFSSVQQIQGDQTMVARDIAVNPRGNISITGDFNGTADFDPGAGTANLTSAGSSDGFLLRLNDSPAAQPQVRINQKKKARHAHHIARHPHKKPAHHHAKATLG